jgi:hypothetical protein
MSLERRGAAVAALAGTVGAGIATLLLGVLSGDPGAVLTGFALAVATVGAVLSAGLAGWVYVSDADGESLYVSPATVASASVLLLVAADNGAARVEPPVLSLALVGAAVLIVVGAALMFVSELRANR